MLVNDGRCNKLCCTNCRNLSQYFACTCLRIEGSSRACIWVQFVIVTRRSASAFRITCTASFPRWNLFLKESPGFHYHTITMGIYLSLELSELICSFRSVSDLWKGAQLPVPGIFWPLGLYFADIQLFLGLYTSVARRCSSGCGWRSAVMCWPGPIQATCQHGKKQQISWSYPLSADGKMACAGPRLNASCM